jgi:hypothetical protein
VREKGRSVFRAPTAAGHHAAAGLSSLVGADVTQFLRPDPLAPTIIDDDEPESMPTEPVAPDPSGAETAADTASRWARPGSR